MKKKKQAEVQVSDSERRIRLLERARKIQLAREDLLDFTEFTMPDPEDMDDATRSLYKRKPHHELLAEALHRVDAGTCLRLAISMPPQHGKTELASKRFAAWFAGRHPRWHTIFAAYNETYARKIGNSVRGIMKGVPYSAVFPDVQLSSSVQAKDALETVQGGQLNFIGRGGSGTGLPANLIVIDDPIKGNEEANSTATIQELHDWYDSVIYSRARTTTAIVVIHTRWVEDDLIGRLCDPDHPWRQTEEGREEAARWDYINIPAILRDDDVTRALGRNPGEALWPEEFSLAHLRTAQKKNPRVFQALYMGSPTPDEGEYFKAEWFEGESPSGAPLLYEQGDLPTRLRIYGASDHAATEKKENDPNVIGCVGVDENDEIWVLPDVVWERMETDRVVEELISQMRIHKPQLWWMESENIAKAFGPFLYKRMVEEKVYCTIDHKTPSTDKRARARAMQGRMSMKMVHFPKFADWWPRARAELLKFPYATHDDFVDFLAWIGRGLMLEAPAEQEQPKQDNVIRVGTMKWVKARSALEERRRKLRKAAAGF